MFNLKLKNMPQSAAEIAFDIFDKQQIKIKKLEEEVFKKTGNKVKILSDRPYSEIESMMSMYIGQSFKSKVMVPYQGQIVKASVIGKTAEWLLLDGGFKDNIYVELKGAEKDLVISRGLKTNDDIDVLITLVDEDKFEIRGSLSSLAKLQVNQELENALDNETFFNALIKEWTPAGYFVELTVSGSKTSGFMPNTLAGINKLPDPKSIVGQNLEVMIENQTKEGFIVSRKKYLQSLIKEKIQSLEQGKIYTGNVTGTTDFGIFVEFETCLTGMIHKANVNPELAPNISKIEPGTEIEFYIKEIVKEKLILTQVLRESLWDNIKIGDKLIGKVKALKNFGALIALDEETNGLIHTSELEKSGQKIHEGQEIRVKIIAAQRAERKIFLTFDN